MPDALHELADRQLAQAARLHARWQSTGYSEERQGLLLTQGALPLPLMFQNNVLRLDRGVPPEQVLAQARHFFSASGHPFAVLTQRHLDADLEQCLAEQGFQPRGRMVAMLLDHLTDAPAPGSGWRIDLAQTPADIDTFIDICREAYVPLGVPCTFTPLYFERREALLGPDVSIALAHDGRGCAGATALVMHTGEVAGVYWMGTRLAAQGAGLASACVARVSQEALRRGARAVALHVTAPGVAAYQRLGFQPHGHLTRWAR